MNDKGRWIQAPTLNLSSQIQRVKSKQSNKTYEQILLRESYREPGAKRSAVRKRTLINLTKYPPQIVNALELALKHQGDLSALTAMSDIALAQGPAVGAVFTLLEVARRLGIEKALGNVTSSYLEGDHNELADWGYNRDKKRGKKQIVIGLLCDEEGEPVSVEVFAGNTADPQTFGAQVKKVAERFGCRRVAFVGDRGMIKSAQIEDLESVDFHYITAITKAQIRSLIKKGVFQLELFDRQLCEIQDDGVRYVLRRNPLRAKEMAASRASKLTALQRTADAQNRYLSEHPRADDYAAWKKVSEKESCSGLSSIVTVTAADRRIHVEVDTEHMAYLAELDGCYALKTDVPDTVADMELIHSRYKDLAMVETAFRTCKTNHLEVRPVFVRTAANTRGACAGGDARLPDHTRAQAGLEKYRADRGRRHPGARQDLRDAIVGKRRRRLSADTRANSNCQRAAWSTGFEAAADASEISSRGRHQEEAGFPQEKLNSFNRLSVANSPI
jgi:hypothetical protein